jgi:hypothetical protein
MLDETETSIPDQCRHMGCVCEPLAGENYCSPHCEGTAYEDRCDCGHDECQGKAADTDSQTGGLI